MRIRLLSSEVQRSGPLRVIPKRGICFRDKLLRYTSAAGTAHSNFLSTPVWLNDFTRAAVEFHFAAGSELLPAHVTHADRCAVLR